MRWLFLLVLLSSASFSIISNYSMDVAVDNSGMASVVSEMNFADSADEEVAFCFSGEVSNVQLADKSGLPIIPTAYEAGGFDCVSFIVPYDYAKLSFGSYEFTSKNGSVWDFHTRMHSSEKMDAFDAQLTLPPGSTLQKTNGAVSSAGDALRISWESQNINASKRLYLAAGYELAPASDSSFLFLLFAAIIVIIVVASLFYLKKISAKAKQETKPAEPEAKLEAKKPEAKPKPEEWLGSNDVFRTLDEVDKEIVHEIAKQKGKTTQAKIYLNTHIAKATLSRRLASLENRGIIQKSQKGNRNLITLNLEKK